MCLNTPTARRVLALVALLMSCPAHAQEPALLERVRACGACHGEDGNSRSAGIPSIAGQPKTFLETQLVLFREGVRPAPPQKQRTVTGLDDRQISAIAAFLSERPTRVEPGEGDPPLLDRGRAVARQFGCGGCHLPDFRGRGQIPRLARQREDYLVEAMTAFRDSRRLGGDTIMALTLHGVSDADIRALAHYLAHQ